MTLGNVGIAFSLEFESQVWLEVPIASVRDSLDARRAWCLDAAGRWQVDPAWEYDQTALAAVLEAQLDRLDPSSNAWLLYCPRGLPAVAGFELHLDAPQPGLDVEQEVRALRSLVPIRPEAVVARGLGAGFAFSRQLERVSEDDPGVRAELGAVFNTPDAFVFAIARGDDPASLVAMAPDFWTLVESIVLG
ncbi:hypothetical protein [Agromyces seonyuensis]|uniref:Uncharacterized protein n=1 Tax=Agromyces seonyuensis TaxID=2662446 RepID=A0A6I4P0C9_9MICO|nr:hypothetical protein [Agromyces seonyuensis]MWB98195.1 hypothetical protein [Agromyces seonyuensis]